MRGGVQPPADWGVLCHRGGGEEHRDAGARSTRSVLCGRKFKIDRYIHTLTYTHIHTHINSDRCTVLCVEHTNARLLVVVIVLFQLQSVSYH